MSPEWMIGLAMLAVGVFGQNSFYWYKAKSCFRGYAKLNDGRLRSKKSQLILALKNPKGAELRFYPTKGDHVTCYFEPIPDSLRNFQIVIMERRPLKFYGMNYFGLNHLRNVGSEAFQKKYQVYCDDEVRAEQLVAAIENTLMYPPRIIGPRFSCYLLSGAYRFLWKKLPSSNTELEQLQEFGQKVLSEIEEVYRSSSAPHEAPL